MSKIKTIAFAAAAIATAIGAGYVYLESRKAKNAGKAAKTTAKEFNIPKSDFVSDTVADNNDETLNAVFASIKATVPFDRDWKNGTGYFNDIKGILFGVPTHSVVKCVDDHGRKMIIIVEEDNNHTVFFQRYSNRNDIICAHSLDDHGHYSAQKSELSVLALAVATPAQARDLLNAAK